MGIRGVVSMPGLLLQNDLEIQRYYFNEALEYYGIDADYYQVKEPTTEFTSAGELSSYFYDPVPMRVIFDQVPKVNTLKKLGWVTELNQDSQPIIHVPFDTPGIQVGALFRIADPLRPGSGRLFRATKMTTGIIYPVAATLQIVAVVGDSPEETVTPYDGNKTIFIDNTTEAEEDVY